MTRGTLGLRPADGVQRHVSLPLKPMLGVIGGLSMSPEDQPQQVQPAAPDLRTAAGGRGPLDTAVDRLAGVQFWSPMDRPAVTTSGISIIGQSFQSRSSA